VFGFKMELEDIQIFANEKPVFGTCAGLILMAKDLGDFRVQQLGILNITVKRNAYGSQTESFESEITGCLTPAYQAIFIRAPKIEIAGDTVHICGSLNDDPVWVENDKHMGCSFHPELTEDTRIHAIFLDKIRKQIKKLQMA
ncbi:MAG: pyridoxal 5'-phosphate synthase glutaminase subunit PdxT, partial [Candidatus Marinimicrobia bacterium]|nr:pyridoxal 5'-phosphate synthase glutaminase subunit PdxT [Candidatus Neomarinimicrobiota bacterium]